MTTSVYVYVYVYVCVYVYVYVYASLGKCYSATKAEDSQHEKENMVGSIDKIARERHISLSVHIHSNSHASQAHWWDAVQVGDVCSNQKLITTTSGATG